MASSDDTKFLTGGGGLHQYENRQERESTEALSKYFEEIEGHVERHIGPVELIYDDVESSSVQIDIMVVPATSDRRFHYLVTSGMSNQPMHLNKDISDAEEWQFAELVMALPKYWPVSDEVAMQKAEWFYPIEHLKFLARIPERFNSWLSVGHSIPLAEPSKQIGPKCDMTGFVLDYPVLGGDSFTKMKTWDDNVVRFYGVYPVYCSEMEHKLKKGYHSLQDKFKENQVMEIFDPLRDNVLSTGWRRVLGW
ncbi:MAG: suppressor of fused domain protein [Methyloligellaceae bacterium]